jgi:hypothetical protein
MSRCRMWRRRGGVGSTVYISSWVRLGNASTFTFAWCINVVNEREFGVHSCMMCLIQPLVGDMAPSGGHLR